MTTCQGALQSYFVRVKGSRAVYCAGVEWEDQAELVFSGLEPGNVSFQAREPAMPHAGNGAGAQQAPIKDGDRRFRHGPKSTAINAKLTGEGEFDPVV